LTYSACWWWVAEDLVGNWNGSGFWGWQGSGEGNESDEPLHIDWF